MGTPHPQTIELADEGGETVYSTGVLEYTNSSEPVVLPVGNYSVVNTEYEATEGTISITNQRSNGNLVVGGFYTPSHQVEFINISAHELRTPIQPILVVIDTLLSKKGNIEDYNELLNMIRRYAKRLQRVTENILDVTRIESGSFDLKKELFDLNEVINGCSCRVRKSS
jgi:signal transduction histidine kinase